MEQSINPSVYRKVSIFRERFGIALKLRGTCAASLAQAMDVPISVFSKFLCSADTWEPDPAFLNRIAATLKVPAHWLCGYDVPLRITVETDGCDFCRAFNFGDACTKVDSHGAHICLAVGSTSYPPEKRFSFCPDCGRPLNHSRPDNEIGFDFPETN